MKYSHGHKTKVYLLRIILFLALVFSSITVQAAPKTMPDGGVFDAEFYAATYPNVAEAVGTDENLLYQHYLLAGKAVGLLPYAPSASPAVEVPPLTVTFFDVGEGDSALISVGGEHMLIDGGYSTNSSMLYSYLKAHGISKLKYIVCTHPHEDHVGGLAGALNYASAETAFSIVTSYNNKGFNSFLRYLKVPITIPVPGSQYTLGGAVITVLGPLKPAEDMNNMSIILRLDYGATSFLFTGDMEREEEQDLLAAGILSPVTVLKVGHHGSNSSSTYPFLRALMPQYAVISVGPNDYGHPTDGALSRLRDAGAVIYRTDLNGMITAVSNGSTVAFTVEKNIPAPVVTAGSQVFSITETVPTNGDNLTRSAISAAGSYILNTRSHKFHYPDCDSVKKMSEKNKQVYTGSRDEIIGMGYDPCGNCHP